MRVLHTPVNYGSLAAHSVRCLRLAGIDVRGVIFSGTAMQASESMETVSDVPGALWCRLWARLRWMIAFLRALLVFRPDIIHWYSGKDALPLGLDRWLVRLLGIPRLVEWQGTDIRIPEVEFADNPYYAAAYERGYESRGKESKTLSLTRQRKFAQAGFACAAPVGMLQYVDRTIFPQVYIVPQRLVLSDYAPIFPDSGQRVPIVVHSPSAPGIKGTASVLSAVERLKERYPLDFRLIHGVSRTEALAALREADIVLDQFVLGDRGMAALEAMALGKPVVCYIKPALVPLYPGSPIVNATPDTLPDVLERLVADAPLRHDLGQQGRAYMEAHYNAADLAQTLVMVYQQVMDTHR